MARNHRNAERNGCRAAIEPKVRQIAICGHLDPRCFLKWWFLKFRPLPVVTQCWTGVLRKLRGPMSQWVSRAPGDMDVWLFVFVSLATRRMVCRKSVVDGRLLTVPLLDPESDATVLPWWKSRAGQVNTAPVNCRRRDAAVCGQTSTRVEAWNVHP